MKKILIGLMLLSIIPVSSADYFMVGPGANGDCSSLIPRWSGNDAQYYRDTEDYQRCLQQNINHIQYQQKQREQEYRRQQEQQRWQNTQYFSNSVGSYDFYEPTPVDWDSYYNGRY